jgi:alkanesulfonate monooxygenase SsuD/methylene tetrahydromethanopterin reductase-like flavin-dependent oxidoreductase (luciferase family)
MRLGVSIAQSGRLADPAAIRSAATGAEQVGYSSVWVVDRLGGARPDLSTMLDPLTVLTYAAACTTRVRLGTSVLVAPWYRPALLARSLTSLDVLSDGRLTVGLGLGATLDEFAAVGVPQRELGRRLDDALDVLEATWGAARAGGIAPTLEPAGDPTVTALAPRRPPILLAASTREGLDRVARRADGWNPSGLPSDMLAPMWATVRDLAAGHGRDPDALQLVVRATLDVRDRPVDGDRAPYSGTIEQVAADLADTRRAGAHEVILGVECGNCLDEALDLYARVAEACDVTTAA